MYDYKDLQNLMNELLANPISSMQKSIYDSFAPSRTLQNMINEMMQPYQKLSQTWSQSLSSILTGSFQSIASEMNDAIKAAFDASVTSKELIESIQGMAKSCFVSNSASSSSKHVYDFPGDLSGFPNDEDFVTVDESAIKEYEVPDSIAIPIGHNRIKMRTSDFLSVLSIIISVIVPIFIAIAQSSQPSTKTEGEQLQVEKIQNQLLRSQNQMLGNLLHDIDATFSSQAEFLQSLKESVEAQNTAISDLEESLDSIQQSLDSTNESVNTESEN